MKLHSKITGLAGDVPEESVRRIRLFAGELFVAEDATDVGRDEAPVCRAPVEYRLFGGIHQQ